MIGPPNARIPLNRNSIRGTRRRHPPKPTKRRAPPGTLCHVTSVGPVDEYSWGSRIERLEFTEDSDPRNLDRDHGIAEPKSPLRGR